MRTGAAFRFALAGLVGVGCTDGTEPELPVASTRTLAVGGWTACALDIKGETSCWGPNNGHYDSDANPIFVPQFGLPVKAQVPRLASLNDGASYHMCGLTTDRAITCWGRGSWGQLGRGVIEPYQNTPAMINSAETWAGVNVGRLTSCGWTTDGTAYCWGFDQHGNLGDPAIAHETRVTSPNRVTGGIAFSSVSPGWQHTCGIASSGAAYCWGMNDNGQLGIGTSDELHHPTPSLVSPELRFRKLSLGMRSTCGIAWDNKLYCWGYNGTGQLGDGTTSQRTSPTPVSSTLRFVDISVGTGPGAGIPLPTGLEQGGAAHACAIAENGTAWCWGWNGAGQLGDASDLMRLSPVRVASEARLTSIASGGDFTCATGETGVWCWGSNDVSQLGDGTRVASSVPVAVKITWP